MPDVTIFGVPIVVSELIPPGEVWTVGLPQFPGGPPSVVRLVGVRDAKERNCYICGADTNRICWCHDGPIWVSDGLPCLCDLGRESNDA